MATKPTDDPMDLGPFLQNYVLKNPFHDMFMACGTARPAQSVSPSHVVTPSQSTTTINKTKINVKKGTVQSLLQSKRVGTIGSISQCSVLESSVGGVPGRPRLKAGRKSKYAAAIASLKQKDMALDLSLSESYKSEHVNAPSMHLECVDGSPKQELDESRDDGERNVYYTELFGEPVKFGHVGSNWAFAESLKRSSISPDHVKIQSWLKENYKYIAHYTTCGVASRQVLRHVQQAFPYITSAFLNRVVTMTYPSCVIIKRTGHGGSVFQGLVAKPDEEALDKPEFKTVFKKFAQGLVTIAEAEQQYSLDASVVGALLWCSTELESSGDLSPVPSSHHSPSDTDTLQNNLTDSGLPSWKRRRRSTTSRPTKRSKSDRRPDPSLDSDSESADFEMMLRDIQGQTADDGRRDMTEIRNYSTRVIGSVQSVTSPRDGSGDAVIKTEPTGEGFLQVDDCGDDDASTAGDVSDNFDATAAKSVENSRPSADRTALDAIVDSARDIDPPRKSDTADQQVFDLKKQLVRAEKDIKHRDRTCTRLEVDLKAAQDGLLAQQEELNTRDFHLAHLAEDFFKLHDQFKQLARQFQLVLGETQQQNVGGRNGFLQNGTVDGHT